MKPELTEYQQYLFHNLAMNDNAFYCQLLNKYLPTNEQIHELDTDQAHTLFEFLCYEASKITKGSSFNLWVDSNTERYCDKG